ncbi:MAG: HD domain-containing phosphohydrolase [Acidimicrobiales bacterium]
MTVGPTKGAVDSQDQRWGASPVAAVTIRVLAAAIPFVVAWFTIAGFSDLFIRPTGSFGLAIWLGQAFMTGVAVSMATEYFTRRLLPLASLYNMTLVFPDRAPSRFGVALRSSTVKRLQARYADVEAGGLAAGAGHEEGPGPSEIPSELGSEVQTEIQSESVAAANAIELIGLLSSHDRLTRGHTERVRAHAVLIAEEMGVSAADRDLLTWGAMLHDIGKLTVSPEILNKPGKPTDEEWQQLRGHPAASADMLAPLQGWLGDWMLAASQHHERWDGTGYPAGLAGTEISLAGRITAVADAYDVITSKRSYKKPMSSEAARQELIRCAGSQFDPDVVRAFLNISLRRRWASGPLASLIELPKILNLGANLQSTAVIVAGTAATVGSVTMVPPPIPQELASTAPETVEVVELPANDEPVDPGNGGATVPADRSGPVSELPVELQVDVAPLPTETTAAPETSSSTQPAESESTLQLDPVTDAVTSLTTISTVPMTLWPDPPPTTAGTANPPTTGSTTTTSTTTGWSPTTTTAAPTTSTTTTTTAPPTTTTTAPTTTTTTAPTTTTTAPTTSTTTPGSPLAINDSVSVQDDKDVSIPVLDNDDQGNSAFDEDTLEILSPPSNAKDYRVHNDHIHYQSNKDYEGTETIVYRICNENGLCDTGLVTIEVTP